MRSLAYMLQKKAEREAREKARELKRIEKEKEKERNRKKREREKEKRRKEKEKKLTKEKEKKRLKKEKEREKRRIKKIPHKKRLKYLQNQRYYKKVKKKREAERKKTGDELSYFSIFIVRDKQKIKHIGRRKLKSRAYELYEKTIEENEQNVPFPREYVSNSAKRSTFSTTEYEIIMVKSVKDDEETISQFRNKQGKYVDNVISNWKNRVIVAKHPWLVEEKVYVYGYHPIRDKKSFDFVLNNLVLNDIETKDDIRCILTLKNKIIFKYVDDFTFVVCKTPHDAERLYKALEKHIPQHLKPYIYFLGEVTGESSIKNWVDKLVDKTGWDRQQIYKNTSKNHDKSLK